MKVLFKSELTDVSVCIYHPVSLVRSGNAAPLVT